MAWSRDLPANFSLDFINVSEVGFNWQDISSVTNTTRLLEGLPFALSGRLGLNSSCNVTQLCLRAHPGDLVPYDNIPDCYDYLLRSLPSDAIVGSSEPATWEVAIKTIFYIAAILITIFGNLWVLTTIFLTPKMYIPTYYFLANLAFSDLVVGFLCMPLHLARHLARDWPFGPHMCKIYQAAQILAVTSNVLFLSLIAADRFFAIVLSRNLKPQMSTRLTRMVIGLSWLTSIAFASPLLAVTQMQRLVFVDREVTWCAEQWPRYLVANDNHVCRFQSPQRLIFYVTHVVALFFVPLLVMAILYVLITLKLCRKCFKDTTARLSTVQNAMRAKVVRTLVVILLAFTICWTPQQIRVFYFAVNLTEEKQMSESVWYVTVLLAYLNSAANPVIYAALHTNFRKSSHALFERVRQLKLRVSL
uniref:Orphan G-protein coupled receptor 61 n=1 Tax=Platynereis dumerilii TaxID=6359 RepID=A0A0K0PUW8_PLADU|nr:orphan G-protein coupled receptor 61 [Platynereis dumerilii]